MALSPQTDLAALVSSGHRVYSGHRQHTFYIRSCFSPDDRHVLSGH